MGRFSPTVGPPTGPTLGDVLAQGLDDIVQRREQRQEREYQHQRQAKADALAEALSRAQLDDQGVRFGTPPAETDRTIAMPQMQQMQQSGDDLATALRKGMSVGGENEVAGSMFDKPVGLAATPGINGNVPHPLAQTAVPTVPLGVFDSRTGTFNRGGPPPGALPGAQPPQTAQLPSRYRDMGGGMYRDQYQTPAAQKRDTDAATREQAHADRLAEILTEAQARRDYALPSQQRPVRDPVADHQAIRDYDIKHPLPSRAAQGGGSAAGGQLRVVPAGVATAHSANVSQLTVLDRAIAGLEANPNAVGLKGYLPGAILNRMGGKGGAGGVGVRADVADVGSLVIHDRSGAAVTVSEYPRLQPFIPSATDDAKTALVKLQRMRSILADETAAMASFYTPEQGYRGMPNGRSSSGSDINPPQGPGGGTGDIDLRARQVPTRPPNDASLSDADLWEQLVAAGVSKAEATQRVQARKKGAP